MKRAALCLVVLSLQSVVSTGQAGSSEQPGAIAGVVVDRDSERPLARAVVEIGRVGSDWRSSTRTDAHGAFALTGLEPGHYWGRVQPGAHRRTHFETTLDGPSRAIDLRPGETRQLRIELPPALAITVRVVDGLGEPLSSVHVLVRDSLSGNPLNMRPRLTDDRGHLRVYGLRPGTYIVCADRWPIGMLPRKTIPGRERLLRTCYPGSSPEAEAQVVRLVD